MAVKKRPAKIASQKKGGASNRICPKTGKTMTPVRIVRQNKPSGMYWVVTEDFNGKSDALDNAIPT